MKQAFLVTQQDSLAIDELKAETTRLSSSNRYYSGLIIGLTFLTFLVRLLTAPAFIETREGIFYVRGVVRYSVAELRPYWPGYPVYMWLGKLFNFYTRDPIFALHLLGILS